MACQKVCKQGRDDSTKAKVYTPLYKLHPYIFTRARMREGVKQSVLSVCQSVRWVCVYLIETKAVNSSAFPALCYLTLVLSTILIRSTTCMDTVETGHVLTPSTCSRSPASSLPGLRKVGRGPGNEATHLSGRLWAHRWVKYVWGRSVTHLLTASGGVAGGHKFNWKV